MKLRLVTRLRPNIHKSPGVIASADLKIDKTRLRAKFLVFDDPKNLRRFWLKQFEKELGRKCPAAVSSLQRHIQKIDKDDRVVYERLEVDRRYFCLICICRSCLIMRIISHEAVHAGFAFARRVKRTTWDDQIKRLDEEAVAYPAGEIAREIAWFCEKNKLYPQ